MFSYNFSTLPTVTMTGKVSERSGWSHNGRNMEVNMLVLFQGGECVFRIGGTDYHYQKGDAALVPKYTNYKPHTDTFCEYTFFHFDGDLTVCDDAQAATAFSDARPDSPCYGVVQQETPELYFDYKMPLGNEAQNIERLLRKSADARFNYAGKLQILLSMQFSEMMFYISRAFCAQFRTESELPVTVSRIVRYIKENYMHGITLSDVCKSTGTSKQYCMRVFKKHMGVTVSDYILELRMRHAAYLLRYTYMNVNETADYLGFSSTSYFSRVFKKYYGTSPSEYSV